MDHFNLAIAWNWEFDADFIAGIERECTAVGLTSYRVEPHNLQDVLQQLRTGKLAFDAFYDRASDADESFLQLIRLLEQQGCYSINPHEYLERATDKATMHLELMDHGLNVPFTIIISPYNKKKEVELSLSALERLGRPFIIKPANTTGGGIGVVTGAETLKDIIETRQHHKNDKYLLQETIRPVILDGRRAWFRVLFAFRDIIPCWWDDVTRIYAPLSRVEERKYRLGGLRKAIATIHDICRLDFFSSEIALTEANKLVVVDYVNEICDMRLQSKTGDGVPDDIVHRIERLLVRNILKAVGS